jgi:glycosyltransferase involved in cell wall biosynthesis
MEGDGTRRHDAVLVNQGVIEVPDALADAATTVHRLDQRDLGRRAAALRSLAAGYDAIVLHIHPYDAVSVAALGHHEMPPTVFLNHAGHVFWLGADAFDVVACVRPVELELAALRRHIDRDALVLFPSMIDADQPRPDRAAARRSLGLDDDAVVALTVASGYKYEAGDGIGFVELLRPLVLGDGRLVLLAVGPDAEGDWAALAAETDGRCRAVGRQDDLAPYLAAADFYVDSHPLTSPTSILEAAVCGLPAVSFRPDGPDVLGADDAGFGDAMLLPETLADFRSAVRRLIDDADERAERGRRLGAGVRRVHGGDHWSAALSHTYAVAAERAATRRTRVAAEDDTPDVGGGAGDLDERLLAVHEAGGVIRPIPEIAAAHGLRLG